MEHRQPGHRHAWPRIDSRPMTWTTTHDTPEDLLKSPRRDLSGRRIVLGLSGGIACYKSAELLRLLVKAGADVRVVMTEGALRFITAETMQALSGHPVATGIWDAREPNGM